MIRIIARPLSEVICFMLMKIYFKFERYFVKGCRMLSIVFSTAGITIK